MDETVPTEAVVVDTGAAPVQSKDVPVGAEAQAPAVTEVQPQPEDEGRLASGAGQ